MSLRRALVHAVAGFTAVALMVGCSSSGDTSEKGGSDSTATTLGGSSGASGSNQGGPPVTGVIERYEGARGDGVAKYVEKDHCDTAPGKATASGSVRLPAGTKGDVIISVGWVNADTSTVIAKRIVELDGVESDSTTPWSTEVEIPDNPGVKIRCNVGAFMKG